MVRELGPEEKWLDLTDFLAGKPPAVVGTTPEINAAGDVMVVACVRVADVPEVFAGSAREKCAGCGQEVWLSPTTKQSTDLIHKKKFLCFQCLTNAVAAAATSAAAAAAARKELDK